MNKDDDLKKDLQKELGSEDVEISPEDVSEDLKIEEGDVSSEDFDLVKKLRQRLKTALEEKQKYLDSWQRDKADFINSRKRDEQDKKQFIQFAEENLICELIPVLDSFEMAMSNKEHWEKADKNWRTGIEYIFSQLSNILANHGLKKIDPKGKIFDPKEQHSVGVIRTHKKDQDHMVLEVVSSGYSLNGKIIKAPQVKVGEYKK